MSCKCKGEEDRPIVINITIDDEQLAEAIDAINDKRTDAILDLRKENERLKAENEKLEKHIDALGEMLVEQAHQIGYFRSYHPPQ